jgi:hypothetical protein
MDHESRKINDFESVFQELRGYPSLHDALRPYVEWAIMKTSIPRDTLHALAIINDFSLPLYAISFSLHTLPPPSHKATPTILPLSFDTRPRNGLDNGVMNRCTIAVDSPINDC